MRKYWLVFTTTLKEYFVYRLNFVIWRVRVFLGFLITFFLWFSVFENRFTFGSYTKTQLLSYIFFANIVSNFVLGTRTIDIASDIINGTIMNYILKPISFFKYYLSRDLADKLLNLVFVVFEVWFLFILFRPPIIIPQSTIYHLISIIFLIIGTLISFFISLSLSFIGFWSNEIWSPRFLFLTTVFFISGSYFPLDLLPSRIYDLLILTPFPYLFYFPTQLFLGKFHLINPIVIISSAFWLIFFGFFTQWLWLKGNRSYSFFGR